MTAVTKAEVEPVSEEVLTARAYLSRVAEPASLAVALFVRELGSTEAARRIRAGDVPVEVEAVTAARRSTADGDADREAASRAGISLLVPESADWPHFAFAGLQQAQQRRLDRWLSGARTARYGAEPTVPLALWVRGPAPSATVGVRSVAVVGARAATPYGEHCAAELAYGLARADVTVVSGGAFGIDAAAHRGALAADGVSVLVSAGGLDRPYPTANRNLFERIAETGLLVSESPPGAAPQKHRFLSRNRIIAALSCATVVVEAAPRSGALNTAAHCVTIGRPVLAVPGPVTSALSAGCHELIRREQNPAFLVTSVNDILEFVGAVGESEGRPEQGPARERRTGDDLDADSRAVLDAFAARSWSTEDQLSMRSALPIVAVLQALPMLRLSGLIESGEQGHRLRRPAFPV